MFSMETCRQRSCCVWGCWPLENEAKRCWTSAGPRDLSSSWIFSYSLAISSVAGKSSINEALNRKSIGQIFQPLMTPEAENWWCFLLRSWAKHEDDAADLDAWCIRWALRKLDDDHMTIPDPPSMKAMKFDHHQPSFLNYFLIFWWLKPLWMMVTLWLFNMAGGHDHKNMIKIIISLLKMMTIQFANR